MLKILTKYAPDAATAVDWQDNLEKLLHADGLVHFTYIVIGLDRWEKHLWVKIGRSCNPIYRIGQYGYHSYFADFKIVKLVDLSAVGWESEMDGVLAEKYMHECLGRFRNGVSEWFTNFGTGIDPRQFANLVGFHWASLRFSGACIVDGEISWGYGEGFPINLGKPLAIL
jgi:hypothetical protein